LFGLLVIISALHAVGDDSGSYDLATVNKKGLGENTYAFDYLELKMGLEPATG
jgi:hypothetical protein